MGRDHLDQASLFSLRQESGLWVWDHSVFRRIELFFFLSIHNDTLKTRTCAKPFPSVRKKPQNVSVIWTLLHSHPGGGLGVVVDEKRSSVGSTADLPTSRQGAWFSGGLRVCGGLRRLLRSRSRGWRSTLLHGGHRCSLLPS